ncbi:MAG TPA: WYL domain-containing protein [Erysipelothrix sp.]|nr:WYL domain-containing protein [Erysipelothrix sp.]
MATLEKGLELLSILSTRKLVSVQYLADELNLSTRSVQRLKNELVAHYYDIETIRGPGGGYRLVGSSDIPLSNLTQEEKEYITSALLDLLQSDSVVYGKSPRRAIEKLIHHFDQDNQVTYIETIDTKQINIEDESLYFERIETLKQAVRKRRRIKINYQTSDDSLRSYIFEPYELFIVNQIWYIGGLNENNDTRFLKVTRMIDLEILDQRYRYDEVFAKDIRVNHFGFKIDAQKVSVLVKNNNYFKEYIWGSNQKITPIDKDTYRIDVEFMNRLGAQSFVLQGGHHFTILKPESLQIWLLKELDKIQENYK